MRGDATLPDVEEFYGVRIAEEDEGMTLDELVRNPLGEPMEAGRGVDLGAVKLRVLSLTPEGRVEQVSVVIHP